MDSSTTLVFVLLFFSTVSLVPYLSTTSIVVNNEFLISSKSPLVFLTLSNSASDFLGNRPLAFLTFSLGASGLLVNRQMILDDMILVPDILPPVNSRISSSF